MEEQTARRGTGEEREIADEEEEDEEKEDEERKDVKEEECEGI